MGRLIVTSDASGAGAVLGAHLTGAVNARLLARK